MHYVNVRDTPLGDSANHERPRQDWIEIPVPALVSESLFALAQEQLQRNKHHSPRRTIEPSLLQGMLVCEKCGYALYRSSSKTSRQKLYYRCLGSDAYRYRNGAVCDNRPIRQDYLDSFIWTEILRLLDDPALIQAELDRRMEAARKADPLRKREESLQREQVRIQKEHRPTSNGVSGKPGHVATTAPTHAGPSQAGTSATVRTAVIGRGGN